MINTPGNFNVIVDSDALIGLIHEDDALHNRCVQISHYLAANSCGTIVPYPIVLEAATTLTKDKTIRRPDLAKKLLVDYAAIENTPKYDVDVEKLVADLYQPATSIHNSPFDHYVLALAKKNGITHVFSFDAFYSKNGLKLLKDVV